MNKYIAFVALALTCLVAVSASPIEVDDDVSSELSLNPSNDEETASLEGKAALFSDYCIRSRDYVIGDIRTNSNGLASNIFKLFFNAAEDIGKTAVNVGERADEHVTKQLRNPTRKLDDFDKNDAVENEFALAQENVRTAFFQGTALYMALAHAVVATHNAVTAKVMSKLDAMKSRFGLSTITGGIKDACNQVDRYDQELLESFERTRAELAEQDPEMAKFELSDIGCVTVRRVIRLDGVCKFAQASQSPLIKAISYQPIPSRQ